MSAQTDDSNPIPEMSSFKFVFLNRSQTWGAVDNYTAAYTKEAAYLFDMDSQPKQSYTAVVNALQAAAQCTADKQKCGPGEGFADCCAEDGTSCFVKNAGYSQCRAECKDTSWLCWYPVADNAECNSAQAPATVNASVCANSGSSCFEMTDGYYECRDNCDDTSLVCYYPVARWKECDKSDAPSTVDATACEAGYTCYKRNEYFSQCRLACPSGQGWDCEAN